jgi:rod shape-determining protein MreB
MIDQPWFVRKIGIDLGTKNTLVFVPGRGIVINEPSVVAISLIENKVLAVGNEAREMLGRTPDTIVASQPLRDGAIADYRVTEAMLRYFIGRVIGRVRLFRPEVVLSIPAGVTSTERRAVIDAALKAGAKTAYVVKEPVLAAIGAGIPIHTAQGNMIINIGGGTSEIAILSLGGVVAARSARVGGNRIDLAISDYIKRKYSLAIGERSAEEIKMKIGAAIAQVREDHMEIRGRDLMGGLPKTITISSNEVTEAMQDELREIINVIKQVLQETPPELSADIMDKGMVLSGGTAQLRYLDQLIAKTIGVPCYVADNPAYCVAKGTGIVLDHLEVYKRSLMLGK